MKAILLLTGAGCMIILTSFDSPTASGLISRLAGKGIQKYIAHEIPLDVARKRYGAHFTAVEHNLHETDDLRVLDFSGERAFKLFPFAEWGPAVKYEAEQATV